MRKREWAVGVGLLCALLTLWRADVAQRQRFERLLLAQERRLDGKSARIEALGAQLADARRLLEHQRRSPPRNSSAHCTAVLSTLGAAAQVCCGAGPTPPAPARPPDPDTAEARVPTRPPPQGLPPPLVQPPAPAG